MTGPQQSPDAPPSPETRRLDELRRLLYRPGAAEEDLRRYVEERDTLRAAREPPAGPAAVRGASARRPPRRAALAIAGGVAVLAAAVTGIAVSTRPATSPVAEQQSAQQQSAQPQAAASPSVTFVQQPDEQDVLEGDNDVTGPTALPVDVDGAATVAEQFEGVGAAVAAVDAAAAPVGARKAVLVLTATTPDPIAWQALRSTRRPDSTFVEQVVARSAATSRTGAASLTLFDFTGAPPSRIAVRAPAGVRWTLMVAFPGPAASGLH